MSNIRDETYGWDKGRGLIESEQIISAETTEGEVKTNKVTDLFFSPIK